MEQHQFARVTDGTHEDSVDDEILSELFTLLDDGNSDGLIHACDLFLTGVPTRLVEAKGALAEGSLDNAGRVAHSLKGSAGAFGARRLSQLAGRLELVCGKTDTAAAWPLVEEMQVEFETFRTILTSRIASIDSNRN